MLYLPGGDIYVPPPPVDEIKETQYVREFGSTGLHEWSGYLTEEFLTELQGQRGANYFEQMRRNSPAIGAMYQAMSMLIRSSQYSIDITTPKADRRSTHDRAMKWLEEVFDDMEGNVNDLLDDACSCIIHGYEVSEFTLKYRDGDNSDYNDGKLGIKNIAPRSQLSLERWVFDKNGNTLGFWHHPRWGSTEVYIPIDKCLHFRTTRERNNPEGYSYIRNSVRSYRQVNVVQYSEGIGVERNLAGLPMVTMPVGATTERDYQRARSLVEKARRDEYAGIVLPPAKAPGEDFRWKFELISSHNVGSGVDTDKIIRRLHTEMIVSMLINFLSMGGFGDGGSYASGRVQGDFFQLSVSGLLSSFEREINEKLCRKLFKLNKFPGLKPDEYTYIRFSPINQRNINTMRNLLRDMAMAGFIDNIGPDIENWLRGQLDLPSITQKDWDKRQEEIDIATQKMIQREQELARVTSPGDADEAPSNLSKVRPELKDQGVQKPRTPKGTVSAKRNDGPTAGMGPK